MNVSENYPVPLDWRTGINREGMRLAFALYADGQKNFPSREIFKHGCERNTPPGHYVALFNRKPRR
jgi:hypothetical protein